MGLGSLQQIKESSISGSTSHKLHQSTLTIKIYTPFPYNFHVSDFGVWQIAADDMRHFFGIVIVHEESTMGCHNLLQFLHAHGRLMNVCLNEASQEHEDLQWDHIVPGVRVS